MDFANAAKRACETSLEDAKSRYKHVEEDNLPYLCMDLVYEFTLLVDGFGKFSPHFALRLLRVKMIFVKNMC